MNRTDIEWTRGHDGQKGYSWNVITGCHHGCEWCYARRMVGRFAPKNNELPKGVIKVTQGKFPNERTRLIIPEQILDAAGKAIPFPVGFEPAFHLYRLKEPLLVKKPSRIFVCSMGDFMMGPRAWIEIIMEVVRACPQHTFIFLTKARPRQMEQYNYLFPDNVILGISTTDQAKYDEAIQWLPRIRGRQGFKIFISFEPLMGPIDMSRGRISELDWIVIGAMTGPKPTPVDPQWVRGIIEQAVAKDVPVFVKDNLLEVLSESMLNSPPLKGLQDGVIPRDYEKAEVVHA